MRRALRLVSLAGLALAAIASPRAQTQSVPATSQADLQRAFDGAIAKWHAKKPAEYEFSVYVSCFCPGVGLNVPFHVASGGSRALVPLTGYAAKTYEHYDTIDKVFEMLRLCISRGPDRMMAQYDLVLGYPIQTDIDPNRSTIDDEFGLRVMGFKALRK